MVRLDGDAEQAIKVVWDRDRVVVRPVGHLDRGSIEAVLGLVACAREAGVIAVVDLDEVAPGDLADREMISRLVADTSLNLAP